MSKEKQIEEMAKILASNCGDCAVCPHRNKDINGVDSCYFKYADMIYNAGYRKQSEWISVEDRLPDKKEYDWVLVNVLLTPENYYSVPQIAGLRNGKWWGNDDFPLSELGCKVTHWMPLPEAPKMRKEDEGK